MSENRGPLTETAERLFRDVGAVSDRPSSEKSQLMSESGFQLLLVPEARGGFGGDWGDVCAVLRLAGFHALDASLADSILANRSNTATSGADDDPFLLGAFTRSALISGALDATLAMSVEYANQRVQFGKPIGKFQVVQHALACFAEEAAAVNCAAQAAAVSLDAGDGEFEVAAAKFRASSSAGMAHATAHQVHGAIGFTQEYALHHWTRRLIHWSCEFGAERHWAEVLGRRVAARGGLNLWLDLTGRSDRFGTGET
jgi:acyl-CoA dehydrogenase